MANGYVDNEADIRALIENWAKAVREEDMRGVVAHHSEDIVLYDVPGEYRGMAAYKEAWGLFFREQGQGAFDVHDLEVVTGDNVAFCYGMVTCGSKDPADQFQVRLTIGLRNLEDTWLVIHEHHSVVAG